MQPWQFVVVTDGAVKRRIREAAEEEERAFYHERASDEGLAALVPLGTDEHKPFLEAAPYLLAIFAQSYGALPDCRKVKNYYLLLVVGYPAAGAVVPVAGGRKKPLSEIATFM